MRVFLRPIILLIIVIILSTGIVPAYAQTKTIRYQAENDYPPYKFMNQGKMQGFDIDYSALIFGDGAYNVEFSADTWDRVYSRLANGEIDTAGLIADLDESEKDILFSKPVIHAYTAVYTRKDAGKITLNDLKQLKVGVGNVQYTETLIRQKVHVPHFVLAIVVALSILIFLLLRLNIKYLKRRLQKEHYFSDSIVNNADIIIVIWNTEGHIVKFNKFGEYLTGFKEEELIGKHPVGTLIPEDLYKQFDEMLEKVKLGEPLTNSENPILCKDGSQISVLWNRSVLLDDEGRPEYGISMGINITEYKKTARRLAESCEELAATYGQLTAAELGLQQQIEELKQKEEEIRLSEERYRLAVEGSLDGVYDWDIKTDRMFFPAQSKEMLGYGDNEEFDSFKKLMELSHPEDLDEVLKALQDHFEHKTEYFMAEHRIRAKTGEYLWVITKGKAVFDPEGYPVRMAGSLTDITKRKEAEKKINKLAYFDPLTDLPNRTFFDERLSKALAEAEEGGSKLALLYLDLDNFKTVNDTMGHLAGDLLLKDVGRMLGEHMKETDVIARWGGDEFAILLVNIIDYDSVAKITERLIEVFRQPWSISGRDFYINASIGITIYPDDGADSHILLKNADTAMYCAKDHGKNSYHFYRPSMNVNVLEKLEFENSIRRALDNNEFVTYYQPLIELKTGKVVGLEALVRWNHPSKGIIPPSDFVTYAEELGLILQIDEWVMRTACKQNKEWQLKGYTPVKVSVNLSAHQFRQKDFVERIDGVLEESGLEAQWLELEITEGMAIRDIGFTKDVLGRLKRQGIKVSLDDFGTGYSSLNYLAQLPVDTLKIDKSFVAGIAVNNSQETVAKTIIDMAHNMNLRVTAEGVENMEQMKFLTNYGCDKVQGFYFCKPRPAEEVEEIIRRGCMDI